MAKKRKTINENIDLNIENNIYQTDIEDKVENENKKKNNLSYDDEDELLNDENETEEIEETEDSIANNIEIDENIPNDIKDEIIKHKKYKQKRKGYFYEEEEQAVVDYLQSTSDEEKDRIFRTILYPAFTQMAEAIIRRYKLYPPDEDYHETFYDAISFLMTKIDRFDMNSNFKAYSYCGTIIKNYLIYKLNTFSKNQKRNESYEDVKNTIDEDINYSTATSEENQLVNDLIGGIIEKVQEMITNYKLYRLTRDEITVGNALINVLKNWDELLLTNGSNKFTKSSVLLLLKETTNMTTKQIRDGMRKYKAAYYDIKNDIISQQ